MNEFWQGFMWGVCVIAALEAAVVFAFHRIMSRTRTTG